MISKDVQGLAEIFRYDTAQKMLKDIQEQLSATEDIIAFASIKISYYEEKSKLMKANQLFQTLGYKYGLVQSW